jgi:hypothetical protein
MAEQACILKAQNPLGHSFTEKEVTHQQQLFSTLVTLIDSDEALNEAAVVDSRVDQEEGEDEKDGDDDLEDSASSTEREDEKNGDDDLEDSASSTEQEEEDDGDDDLEDGASSTEREEEEDDDDEAIDSHDVLAKGKSSSSSSSPSLSSPLTSYYKDKGVDMTNSSAATLCAPEEMGLDDNDNNSSSSSSSNERKRKESALQTTPEHHRDKVSKVGIADPLSSQQRQKAYLLNKC